MDQNKVAGTIRSGVGKAEQRIGEMTGDAGMQAEGVGEQIAGKAQQWYGHTREAAADAADVIADQAVTLEEVVREQVKSRPYLALGAAFALGVLLSHQLLSRR